jgi:hypothetical protein
LPLARSASVDVVIPSCSVSSNSSCPAATTSADLRLGERLDFARTRECRDAGGESSLDAPGTPWPADSVGACAPVPSLAGEARLVVFG